MTLAEKTKNVSNLALQICSVLDLVEDDNLDMNKIQAQGYNIDRMFYDLARQIKKKSKDEFYELDVKSDDLIAMAEAAEKHVTRLRNKCTYRSMLKTVESMRDENCCITAKVFQEWSDKQEQIFYVCGLLHRMVCVMSFQAIQLRVLESEDDANRIENVMLEAVRSEIARADRRIW